MGSFAASCLALLLSLSPALATAARSPSLSCAPGLYIVVARGTTEPAGSGITGIVARSIAATVKGSVVVPLDYPATFVNPAYLESMTMGVEEVQRLIAAYTTACSNSKIALLGFSQGAEVMANALCGGSGLGNRSFTPVEESVVKKNVVSVVLLGDPTHAANMTYNRGTSTQNGLVPRDGSDSCQRHDDRLISYCDTGDLYCDSGNDPDVHITYVTTYASEMVRYVVDRFHNETRLDCSVNGTHTGEACRSTTASISLPVPTQACGPTCGPVKSAAEGSMLSGGFLALLVSCALATGMGLLLA